MCTFGVTPGHRLFIKTAITPHQSSHYPKYLSPTWDKDTQRAVVWTRLQEHHKLANQSLAKVNEGFWALSQELQPAQARSSHKPLSHEIASVNKQFHSLHQELTLTQAMSSHKPLSCDRGAWLTACRILWLDPHFPFYLLVMWLLVWLIVLVMLLSLWCSLFWSINRSPLS